MKLATEVYETTSAATFDVINNVEVQQILYIGRVVDIPVVRGKMATSIVTRGLCVLEARDVRTELVHG